MAELCGGRERVGGAAENGVRETALVVLERRRSGVGELAVDENRDGDY